MSMYDFPERHMPVTRRFFISTALLIGAVFFVALSIIPVLYAVFAPVPFRYEGVPFPICDGYSVEDTARCDPPSHPFRPGDTVPFLVTRCVNNLFDADGQVPYTVSRNLVRSESGIRIILPPIAATVESSGCPLVAVTNAHSLPDGVPPGKYYLEGVATVYGQFRTSTSYFRTVDFTVVSKD